MDPSAAPLVTRFQQHLAAIVTEDPPPELDVVLVGAFTAQLDGSLLNPPPPR